MKKNTRIEPKDDSDWAGLDEPDAEDDDALAISLPLLLMSNDVDLVLCAYTRQPHARLASTRGPGCADDEDEVREEQRKPKRKRKRKRRHSPVRPTRQPASLRADAWKGRCCSSVFISMECNACRCEQSGHFGRYPRI